MVGRGSREEAHEPGTSNANEKCTTKEVQETCVSMCGWAAIFTFTHELTLWSPTHESHILAAICYTIVYFRLGAFVPFHLLSNYGVVPGKLALPCLNLLLLSFQVLYFPIFETRRVDCRTTGLLAWPPAHPNFSTRECETSNMTVWLLGIFSRTTVALLGLWTGRTAAGDAAIWKSTHTTLARTTLRLTSPQN